MQRLPLPVQGILWMIITGFLAVCIYGMALHLNKHFGFHPFQIVFFYNLTGLLFYLPSVWRRHIHLGTTKPKLFLLRGFLEFAGFSLSITGLTMLPMPVHTSLSFTSPLFGSLAAVLILREQNNMHRWISLLIGFAGVLIVSRPGAASADIPLEFVGCVLLAALSFAFCGITIKKLTATEPTGRIAFYMMLVTAIIAAPFASQVWMPVSMEALPFLFVLGGMVAAVQFTVSLAYSKADVTVILPFNFMNLVWSSLIAFFVFGQIVDGWTILGGFIIVLAAVYGLRYAGRTNVSATSRAAVGGS